MADGRPVYSTDDGDLRRRRPAPRAAKSSRPGVPDDGIVRVGRERAGRKGAGVTVVHGLPGGDADRRAVLRELKRAIGSGGALKGDVLELHGDHRDRVAERLTALGHRVKLMGG